MAITKSQFQQFITDYREKVEIPRLKSREKAGAVLSTFSFAIAIILALGIVGIVPGTINGYIGGLAGTFVVFSLAVAVVIYTRIQQKAKISPEELKNRMLLGVLNKWEVGKSHEAIAVASPDYQTRTYYSHRANRTIVTQDLDVTQTLWERISVLEANTIQRRMES